MAVGEVAIIVIDEQITFIKGENMFNNLSNGNQAQPQSNLYQYLISDDPEVAMQKQLQELVNQPVNINTNGQPVGRNFSAMSALQNVGNLGKNALTKIGEVAKDALLGKQGNALNNSVVNPRLLEYQDYLRDNGYDENTVNGVAQGLNGGNEDISAWINQYNQSAEGRVNPINIPRTEQEINLARQGMFNSSPLQASVGLSPRQGGLIRNFATGFNDNFRNPISIDNFGQGAKPLTQRLGEGVGTLLRVADSPLGRGLIAGGLTKALGYDNALQEGLTAMVTNQQKRLGDQLYRNALQSQGVDVSNLPNGYVGDNLYKNLSLNAYRTQRLQTQQNIANAKDNTARAKMIINAYNNNIMTEEEAINELQKYGVDVNDLDVSNATKRTDVYANESQSRIANNYSSASYKDWLRNGGRKGKGNDSEQYEALAEFQDILSGGDAKKIQFARNAYIKRYGKDPQKLIAKD